MAGLGLLRDYKPTRKTATNSCQEEQGEQHMDQRKVEGEDAVESIPVSISPFEGLPVIPQRGRIAEVLTAVLRSWSIKII